MTLVLQLIAPPSPALSGGPLVVQLNLRNVSPAAVQVPVASGASPFEYLLLSADGATTLQTLSAHQRAMARGRGRVPRTVLARRELPAGQFTIYRDDVAALLVAPLEPGLYQLEALYRAEPGPAVVRSGKVPLVVRAR